MSAIPQSPLAPSGAALARLPVVYGLSFAVLGCVVPYLALEFREWGLGGAVLAVAMGCLPAGRLLAGPAWAMLADRYPAPARVIRAGSALALGGVLVLAAAEVLDWTPPAVAVVAATLLFAVGRAPMGPVVDALTLAVLGGDRLAYGRLRRWGSIGFLVVSLLAGWSRKELGLSPLVPGAALALGLVLVVYSLPDRDRIEAVPILPALRRLLLDRAILWLVVGAALHFAAHVGSTSFLAVHMDALGLSSTWTGLALATGVTVEVVVLSRSRWLLSRFRAEHVYLFAVLLALPRWLAMAQLTSPVPLVALQTLHGITFGAFWVAGVQVIARRSPPEVANSGQALFGAAVGGVGAALGMVGGSFIVDALPTRWLFHAGAVAAALAILATLAALRCLRRDPMR